MSDRPGVVESSRVLGAALVYALRGWRVFPVHGIVDGCCTCGKDDCAAAGKHPNSAGWRAQATTDSRQLKLWWQSAFGAVPVTNIGLATGAGSGLFIVDIDTRHGGDESLEQLIAEHADDPLPPTITALTGGGGRHLLFAYPSEGAIKNRVGLRPGLDIRGDGGFVVAPPSLHVSGRHYDWAPDASPADRALATAPAWLVAMCAADPVVEQGPPLPATNDPAIVSRARAYLARIDGAVAGEKGHDRTIRVACILTHGFTLDEESALALMREYNERCRPPWSEKELRYKVTSALASTTHQRPRGHLLNGQVDDEDRPVIRDSTDETEVVRQAISAIARAPDVYVRAGTLTCVVRDVAEPAHVERKRKRERMTPSLRPIKLSWVSQYLTREARWINAKDRSIHPPAWAVQQVYDAPTYPGVRPLRGVVETPVLRPDGTVLVAPGYDDDLELLYEPVQDVDPIPEHPTRDDALCAWAALYEVVRQFPFEAEVHKAAWLASLLTMFARWSFEGPTPLFFFDANTPGSGKTKLATVTGIIALGRVPALTSWSTVDHAENNKAITALLLEGDPLVIFDNVEGKFGDASIKKLLTGTTWKERILGVNKTTGALPNLTTWFATSNNVQLKGKDMPRRLIGIRLRSELECPNQRADLIHVDLEQYVKDHRPHLAVCALTILRAYHVAGAPDSKLPCGDYPGWSRAVRDAVVWLGLPDPVSTRADLRAAADEDDAEHRVLVTALAAVTKDRPLTAADARARLSNSLGADGRPDPAIAAAGKLLIQYCHARNRPDELPSTQQFAMLLAKHRDAVIGGRRIVGRVVAGGMTQWRIEQLTGDADDEYTTAPDIESNKKY